MLSGEQWSQLLQSFLGEGRDLLKDAEELLLRLESHPGDEDAINSLFRAMHTLKGSAGLFSLTPLVAFTHQLESLLMSVRDGERSLTPALISLMLRCLDELGSMLDLLDLESGSLDVDAVHQQQLLDELAAELKGNGALVLAPTVASGQVMGGDRSGAWHISLRFSSELFCNGFDPATFVRYLGRLGEISHLQTVCDALPTLHEMDPEACYLGLEISLRSSASKAEIEDVFEFIRDFCTLRILPPQSSLDDYLRLIHDLPETDERIGRLLVACGLLTEHELAEGLRLQAGTAAERLPLGTVLVEERMVEARAVSAALEKQQGARERRVLETSMVKVAASKLDELINLVGELVISAASAQVQARRHGAATCIESTQAVHLHVEQIRECALKLRMVEVGDTFNRFHRVVRDVSQALGKRIVLNVQGGETELDKSLIDRVADPLTHLVRNAIDHGIESAEERLAVGKPAEGHLTLNAFHESGSIVLEISDDGRGLNTTRIFEKAVAKGLLDPQATPSDEAIHRLIFEAGFSTADSVSDLSGRGVGMDVVRSAIDQLRGSIDIESRPGQGCTFRIRLPLTLAIIDGFQVSVGGEQFIIPLDRVTECMEVTDERLDNGYGYLNLRGKPLPCIALARQFDLNTAPARRRNIVVVSQDRQQAGLIVDQLHGEQQTVIKPLGQMFGHLQGISGSTILGSGQVALILDIPSLFRQLQSRLDAGPDEPRVAPPRLDVLSRLQGE